MMKIRKIIALLAAFASLTVTAFADFEAVPTDTENVNAEAVDSAEVSSEDGFEAAKDEIEPEPENVINLYVNQRNSDGENTYKNINRAIDAVKSIDRTKQQVIVNIEGGTYDVTTPIVFNKESSGSSEYPVIYRAAKNSEVIINAGHRVSGDKLEDTDKVKNKLPQNVRKKVYKIDLSNFKAEQLGDISAKGANMGSREISVYGNILELVYDGDMMPRASYPNIGSEFVDKTANTTSFSIENKDVPISSWDLSTNLGWMQFIENNGFIYGQGKLVKYDNATKMITADVNGAGFGSTRVRFKNLPEFIDQPGEYSIDFNNLCMYFYPPDENFRKAAYITSFKEPIVQFNEASNIVLDGVKIENGGNDGIVIKSSSNCTVKNSTIKNMSGNGIMVLNSKNIDIDSCSINNVGLNGIFLSGGGTFKTLQSSGNVVENCDIYTVGRAAPVGNLGILTNSEVGTKIIKNRLHDTPHDAIRLASSTECIIENNEVYNAVNDTYDAGAIYTGGSTYVGTANVYKGNYLHNIYRTTDSKGGAVMALYWDDQQSGNTAVNNIFDDNQFSMLVGGGDWNTVKNNIFYNSRASVTVDARGEGWQKAADGAGKASGYESVIGVGNKIWEEKYPYTTKLYNYGKENNMEKINAPDENIIKNNIMIGTPLFSLANSAVKNAIEVSNNERKADDFIKFADPSNYDFTYDKASAPAGYDYIDFSQIGIPSKNPGKTVVIGPCDGATDIEGNNVVLSWKDTNGADCYRVKISLDKAMKALVYDQVVKGKSVQLDNLKYGKTFYWTVQAIKSSKSETDGIISDVSSFTTSKTEKKNTTKLNAMLTSLGNGWRRVTEGNRPGMYKEGAINALDKVVSEAETVYYNNATKMFTVKNVTAKLQNAIENFNNSLNVETVEFGDWLKDTKNWTESANGKTDGEVMHLIYTEDGGNAGYTGAQLSRGQMLKFKIKMDLTNFQMWGFNADEPTGYAWGRRGYSVVIKRDVFEVQRRTIKDGVETSDIIKTFNNEESIMTSDVWHTVETGVCQRLWDRESLLRLTEKQRLTTSTNPNMLPTTWDISYSQSHRAESECT